MGVRFIPAVLTGMYMLSHDDIMKKVEYALLPFILLYTITLASVAFHRQHRCKYCADIQYRLS